MKKSVFFSGARMAYAALSLLLVAAMMTGTASARDDETRLRTRLSGAAIGGEAPSGNAEFRMEAARQRTRLKVEVEDVNLPAGTKLQVVLDHAGVKTLIGEIVLDAFGFGELELNSQDGDNLPAVKKGDIIIVLHDASAILSGVL